ncbi:MAG: protein translocase subunit SecD [Calditrichaeota bacterium]|nr:protein translocase subunit SecD [Calditrichota bacterium]
MSRNLTIKLSVVVFLILMFAYFVYPTIQFQFLMSKEDRARLQIEDPQKYNRLLDRSIRLGLDLQGGMHVVMEVDVKELLRSLAKNKDDRFDEALEYAAKVSQLGEEDFITAFAEKLESLGADLARYYGSRRLRDRNEILDYLREQTEEAVNRSLEILRNRVDQFGVAEPTIQKQGSHRIIIELAGITDPERVRRLLGETALLEFRLLKEPEIVVNVAKRINDYLRGKAEEADTTAENQQETPADTSEISAEELFGQAGGDTAAEDTAAVTEEEALFRENLFLLHPQNRYVLLVAKQNEARLRKVLQDPEIQRIVEEEAGDAELLIGKPDPRFPYIEVYLVNKDPELTGETIVDARQQISSDIGVAGQFEVSLTFNSEGARIFSRVTGANIGKPLAIILDRRVQSAPVIQAKIRDGRARITGLGSLEEAQDLAIVLRAGALPAPLQLLEERTVGPSLGKDSIEKGTYSALLGLLLVALFMVVYYKFSGVIADIALILNIVIILGIMSVFHATLTLPGIAGIILTIGMAVDANVLIFERIREELDKGKTVLASLEEGYSRALSAIIDANITTLIAAIVLYNFGTGPIKGFALTLMIGILGSMVTAIFVTRTIFEVLIAKRVIKRLSI